ncbi:MAG: hypothetical protein ACRDRA_21380 [Pseudonocardiaceae bacterium]
MPAPPEFRCRAVELARERDKPIAELACAIAADAGFRVVALGAERELRLFDSSLTLEQRYYGRGLTTVAVRHVPKVARGMRLKPVTAGGTAPA